MQHFSFKAVSRMLSALTVSALTVGGGAQGSAGAQVPVRDLLSVPQENATAKLFAGGEGKATSSSSHALKTKFVRVLRGLQAPGKGGKAEGGDALGQAGAKSGSPPGKKGSPGPAQVPGKEDDSNNHACLDTWLAGDLAKALACKEKITREEFCEKKPATPGCPNARKGCGRTMKVTDLACVKKTSEEEYCKEHPHTLGCPNAEQEKPSLVTPPSPPEAQPVPVPELRPPVPGKWPVKEDESKNCNRSGLAKDKACAEKKTLEEYCKENPEAPGCPSAKEHSCGETGSADDLACIADKSWREEHCEKNPGASGCPNAENRKCGRTMTATDLACVEDISEEEFCEKEPDTPGCPDTEKEEPSLDVDDDKGAGDGDDDDDGGDDAGSSENKAPSGASEEEKEAIAERWKELAASRKGKKGQGAQPEAQPEKKGDRGKGEKLGQGEEAQREEEDKREEEEAEPGSLGVSAGSLGVSAPLAGLVSPANDTGNQGPTKAEEPREDQRDNSNSAACADAPLALLALLTLV